MKKNQKGFTLVEVLMAGLIMLVAGMSAAGFASLMSRTNSTDQTKIDILSIKAQMAQNLSNERIWLSTVANSAFGGMNNRLFRCFRLMPNDSNHDCTQGEELILYSPDTNAVLYDGRTASTQGFSSKGQPCNTFNPTTPDPSCPIKFNLRWQPICPAAVPNCPIPQVQINADFIYNNTVQSISVINDASAAERISFASVVRIRDSMNPVAVNDVAYTNMYADNTVGLPAAYAGMFTLADSKLTFDPSVNDYTETGGPVFLTNVVGSVVVTATTKQAATTNGGTALIDLTTRQITYTPPLGFYGIDSFNYEIQDAYGNATTGNVRMKIMTPYTWTGFANNTNMSDPKNWCGKVVAGVCDGSTHLIALSATSQSDISHLVFDDTCENTCAPQVNADIQVKSIEIRNFIGTVSFAPGGPFNLKLGWDNLSADPAGHQDVFGAKTFDGSVAGTPAIKTTAGSFIQSGGVFNGSSGNMTVMGQLIVTAGNFLAPTVLEVQSHWRTWPTSFNHNNGTVILGTYGADPMGENMTCINSQITKNFVGFGTYYWCKGDSAWYSAGNLSFNNLELRKNSYQSFPSKKGMFVWPSDPTIVTDDCLINNRAFCPGLSGAIVDSTRPNEGYFINGTSFVTTVAGQLTMYSVNECASVFGDILVSGNINAKGTGCGSVKFYLTTGSCPSGGCFTDVNPSGSGFFVLTNTQIKSVGSGVRIVESDSAIAKIPRLTIQSSGGSVRFKPIVSVYGDYKLLSGALIHDVGSTFYFDSGGLQNGSASPAGTLPYLNPGSSLYENVVISSLGYHLKSHFQIKGSAKLKSTCIWCGDVYATGLLAPELLTAGLNLNQMAFKVLGNVEMDGFPGDPVGHSYLPNMSVVMTGDQDATYKATRLYGFKSLYVFKAGGVAKVEFLSTNNYFPRRYYHASGVINQNPIIIRGSGLIPNDPQLINEYDSSLNGCFADLRIETGGGAFGYDVGMLGTEKVCVNGKLEIGGSYAPNFMGTYNRFNFGVGLNLYGNLKLINFGISSGTVGNVYLVGGNNSTVDKDGDASITGFTAMNPATQMNFNLVVDKNIGNKVTALSNNTNSDIGIVQLKSGEFDMSGKTWILNTTNGTGFNFMQTGGLLNINAGVFRSDFLINGGVVNINGGRMEVDSDFFSPTGLRIRNANIVKNGGYLQLGYMGTNIFTGFSQRFPLAGYYQYSESACPAPPTLPLVSGDTSGGPSSDPKCVFWNPSAMPTPEVPFDNF